LKSVAHLKDLKIHKSKYQRGRRADKEMWVFGITDTSTKPAITYTETVEKRDAATLLPIIEKVVYSDKWRAYRQIQPKLGLQQLPLFD
jgi:transposase-like protein